MLKLDKDTQDFLQGIYLIALVAVAAGAQIYLLHLLGRLL